VTPTEKRSETRHQDTEFTRAPANYYSRPPKLKGDRGKTFQMDLTSLKQLLTTYTTNMERTYIMVKPDGVQRGLVSK